MSSYITLGHDLDDLIDGYESNFGITENQREIWCKKNRCQAMTHESFGNNHPNALRLLEEDDWDGRTVGSLRASTARGFWDYGAGHSFPPQKDLVRIGKFFAIDDYHTIALMLKGQWEFFLGKTVNQYKANQGHDLLKILKDPDLRLRREHNNRFKPDIQTIFDLLERYNASASRAGYTLKTFESMVRNMIKKELHWKANNSPEIDLFAFEEMERITLLQNGSTEEQEAFWIARMMWNDLSSQLDDLNLSIENRRLKNREVERRWLAVFGDLEVELKAAQIRCKDLETRLLLLEANPGMNRRELDVAVHAEEQKRAKELQELNRWTIIAKILDFPDTGCKGTPMDGRMVEEYNKERKRLIREIWILLHPDKLENHPAYHKLTERQKEELDRFLIAALEPDNDELAVPKGFINADLRSPDGLRRVLDRIHEILENAGIDIEVDTSIKGETLTDQFAWLNRENERLLEMLDLARATLKVMVDDEEIKRKKDVLDHPQTHASIMEEFRAAIETCCRLADEMETRLASIL